jgi:hypothetical protein
MDFGMLYEIVSSIIEYNLDIERKQNLFKDKLNELKNLFTTLSYEELKAIQFETPYSLRQQDVTQDQIDFRNPDEPTEEVIEEKIKTEEVE